MKLLADYKPGDKTMLIQASWLPDKGTIQVEGYRYTITKTIRVDPGKYIAEVRLQAKTSQS